MSIVGRFEWLRMKKWTWTFPLYPEPSQSRTLPPTIIVQHKVDSEVLRGTSLHLSKPHSRNSRRMRGSHRHTAEKTSLLKYNQQRWLPHLLDNHPHSLHLPHKRQ